MDKNLKRLEIDNISRVTVRKDHNKTSGPFDLKSKTIVVVQSLCSDHMNDRKAQKMCIEVKLFTIYNYKKGNLHHIKTYRCLLKFLIKELLWFLKVIYSKTSHMEKINTYSDKVVILHETYRTFITNLAPIFFWLLRWYNHFWQPRMSQEWVEMTTGRMCQHRLSGANTSHVLDLFRDLCMTPSIPLSRSVPHYRRPIGSWGIEESPCQPGGREPTQICGLHMDPSKCEREC